MSETSKTLNRTGFLTTRLSSIGTTFKLTAILAFLVLATCLAGGVPSYFSAGKHLEKEAGQRLSALATARGNVIATYLGSINEDVTALALSANAKDAALMFASSLDSLEGKLVEVLQKAYITGSPNPLGKRYLFETADDETEYSDVHRQNHKSAPMINARKELMAVIAIEMPIDHINAIMDDYAGLSQTGEAVIVGSNFLARDNTRHHVDASSIGSSKPNWSSGPGRLKPASHMRETARAA